jgi:hypothetical protein
MQLTDLEMSNANSACVRPTDLRLTGAARDAKW